MTPFLQFRVWTRRGPTGQRAAAALAAALAVVLVGWAAIPLTTTDEQQLSTGLGFDDAQEPVLSDAGSTASTEPTSDDAGPAAAETQAGAPRAGGSQTTAVDANSGPRSGDQGGSGTKSTAPQTSAPQASDPCAGVTTTDQGVTDNEVFIAVPYIALAGGAANATFGIRSPSEIEKVITAYTDAINAEGGIACRKLRTKGYPVNTIDQNDQRAKCLQIIGDKPFAVVDLGGYIDQAGRACFVDDRIPWIGATAPNEAETTGAYPYVISIEASAERQFRNWVFEAPSRGWFTGAGFTKLGIFLDECNPSANKALLAELANQGVSGNKISLFTMSGCGGIGSPSEISQAVAQHRGDNVSHVFLAGNGANSQNYVRNADGLRWQPRYLTSDYGNQTRATLAPQWSSGFDGAIAITSTRSGERNSGITAPWVTTCNRWLSDRGVPPSKDESDQNPVNTCDLLRLVTAAADAAGANLTRPLLAEGLARIGRFETAGAGDAVFDRRGKVTGGDFIRAITYHSSCRCWKVADQQTKPGH